MTTRNNDGTTRKEQAAAKKAKTARAAADKAAKAAKVAEAKAVKAERAAGAAAAALKRRKPKTAAASSRNASPPLRAKSEIGKSPALGKNTGMQLALASTDQTSLNAFGMPVLALHDAALLNLEQLVLPPGDPGERRMSVRLTYAGTAEDALLSVYVYDRATKRMTGNGIAITPDANGMGEFLAAAGQTYRMICWFRGGLGSSVKVVVSYPANMHIDEPAGQFLPADTEITDPSLGYNRVPLIVPAVGGLK